MLLSEFGNHRCRTGTSAATQARRYKDHVCASDELFDFLQALLCRPLAEIRVSTGPAEPCNAIANGEFIVCARDLEGLSIRIDN